MPFELSLNGSIFNTDDILLREMVDIEAELDEAWVLINPLRSAAALRLLARTFLLRDHPEGEVTEMIDALTVGQARKVVRWVDDDLPTQYEDGIPLAEDAPATTTSSPAPAASTGPPTSS
jgi:hypothetical protein